MIGILWDLDGTLLDTLQDLHSATNYALAFHGHPQRTLQQVRAFVGNGALRLFQQAVPEGADACAPLATFQSYYAAHCQEKTAPYPGILEALAVLGKTHPMAIVSNKPDGAVKTLCAQYFPGRYARGESADCPRKPAPDMVYAAMRSIGVDRCIYVGDSEVDVLTAKNAGVPCLSVLWGFRDREEIAEAGGRFFCSDPKDLPRIIAEMEAQMEAPANTEKP